jgi:hypothetical protein
MLSDLLGENDVGLPVIYSEHLIGDGHVMFEHAAKLNFEGTAQNSPFGKTCVKVAFRC